MNKRAGPIPVTRKTASLPVSLVFLAGPLVWAVLYWVFKLPVGSLWQGALTGTTLWLLLQAVLLYPIVEEIIFRGGLQGWLIDRKSLDRPLFTSSALAGSRYTFWLSVISVPNLLATVAFTALHFINQPPLWAASVFIPSLVFGWARDSSGGLMLPILLHIWYNAGFYLLFVQF